MIIYNISNKVDAAIETEWVHWQQAEHIPEVMASGLFIDFKFCKLLEQEDEDEIIFVIQFYAESIEKYQHYISYFAPILRQKAMDKWGDRFIAFRSVMKVISL